MSLFNDILNSRTINLTTFRKSGIAVHTPVWVVREGDVGYVRTSKTAGKIKRLKRNHKAFIAPCTNSGKITGDKIEVKAEVLELNREEYNKISNKIKKKYNIIFLLISIFQKSDYQNSQIIIIKEK
mgnify:CR=1 FL=1